jgi:hypothetical protein
MGEGVGEVPVPLCPIVNHRKDSCEPLIPCTLPFLFIDKIRHSQFTVGSLNTFVYLFKLFRRNIPRPQIFSNNCYNSVKKKSCYH